MRTIIAALVLSTCAQSAIAKGPDCRGVESTTKRLACYDAVYPLKLEKRPVVEPDAGRPPYKDPFAAEEARRQTKEYLSRLLKYPRTTLLVRCVTEGVSGGWR